MTLELNITLPPGMKVLPPTFEGMSMIGPIFPPGIRCKPPPLKTQFLNGTKGNLGWGITLRQCKTRCLKTINCSFAVYYRKYESEESIAYERAQLTAQRDQIRFNAEYKPPRPEYYDHNYTAWPGQPGSTPWTRLFPHNNPSQSKGKGKGKGKGKVKAKAKAKR
jgi:hypothetical protein